MDDYAGEKRCRVADSESSVIVPFDLQQVMKSSWGDVRIAKNFCEQARPENLAGMDRHDGATAIRMLQAWHFCLP